MVSDIESKQSKMLAEAKSTNESQNLNYEIDGDITCADLVENLKNSIEAANEQLHERLEISTNVTAILTAVDKACDDVNSQLDSELEKSKLEVTFIELLLNLNKFLFYFFPNLKLYFFPLNAFDQNFFPKIHFFRYFCE